MPIIMTPGQVIGLAAHLHDSSRTARTSTTLDDAVAASATHTGWQAATANTEALKVWRARLHTMADEVEAAAEAMRATANDYVSTDRMTAQSLAGDARHLGGA